jgi:2-keto-4-pentenoate hydratase
MKKDNEFKLANIIWNHWQNGTLIDDITVIDDIAPKDRTDGYEVQKYFNEFSSKDIFGWKIAASNKAGQEHIGAQSPLAGVLLEEKKNNYNESIKLLPNQMLVAEVEFIFKMKHDLDFNKSNYSEQETLLIIESLYAGIELPDSRFYQSR